jgi:hypothetical protein
MRSAMAASPCSKPTVYRGDLVKLWVGHSNLEITSNYTHFPQEYRKHVASETGLFAQASVARKLPVGPQWSQLEQASGERTCHVTCSRMRAVTFVGEWLSLVEHLVRDQGVGGSNPLSPTNFLREFPSNLSPPWLVGGKHDPFRAVSSRTEVSG